MNRDFMVVSQMRQKELTSMQRTYRPASIGTYRVREGPLRVDMFGYKPLWSPSPSVQGVSCTSPDCVLHFPMNGMPASPSRLPVPRYDQFGFTWFWILELTAHFSLQRQSAHLARQYAFIILRKRLLLVEDFCYFVRSNEETVVLRQRLQRVATTCVFMAAKIEEVFPPKATEFADFISAKCGFECTSDDLIRNEMDFVEDLDWNFHPVTAYSWLMFLVAGENQGSTFSFHQIGAHGKILDIFLSAVQLMDIGFLDAQAWSYLPSTLAGAALVLVDADLDYLFVAQFLQLDASVLYDCVVWLRSLVAGLKEWESDGTRDNDRWSKVPVTDTYFIQRRVVVPPALQFGLLQSDGPKVHRQVASYFKNAHGMQVPMESSASPSSSDYCLCCCKNGVHTCGLIGQRVHPYQHGWQYVGTDPNVYEPPTIGCRGVIELDQVDSVTTAKEFGVGAFQIRCHHRKYVLRAESKDRMQDWLFNFQRSIANIISMLLQTVHSHANRPHRDTDFHLTRKRRTARSSRSISLDLHDIDAFGPCDLHLAPDDSESSSSAMSPRKSSAFRPKSPLGMFDFDLSEENESSTPSNVMPPRNYHRSRRFSTSFSTDTRMLSNSFRPSDTATETHQMEQHDHDTQRPLPVTRAYVPRYIRDRENATAVTPPTSPLTSGRWTSRHHNEREETRTLDSMVDMTTTDAFSYTDGNEAYGVTSLLGVRNNMEDLCCCIPDLNAHFALEYCQKQAIYALFDGHAGVQAAQFANDRLAAYICAHHDFYSNTRRAFDECFRRVDKEFLAQAAIEKWSAGTTVALVFIRGNKLLTANIGDSRAVVCLGEDALDVIEEQTPGRKDERDRIEQQGGWVKEERELHISKLHSMDLSDPRIKEKAERIVRWVHIYRVNGELAVSRAIGDLEYKGRALSEYAFWAFPEGHDRVFHGDLVIPVPEFKEIEITSDVAFLILACDGLWDTITSQEAVRHVRERLQKGETAEIASRSLANLAIRSGSSDNVSVIVVRFNCNCGN
uniref:Protein phosphatase 1E putative n=1 Tax=Albugo laibachii Nc14 TaxID=890382 RepID=F0WZ08_9STRA|nr:protein phosphatase 1E putative [Albugo laibachii Nc14]|eukprot:CCA26722.1 protein phosphatase 1E putative [Albugo laibachii Nc14]